MDTTLKKSIEKVFNKLGYASIISQTEMPNSTSTLNYNYRFSDGKQVLVRLHKNRTGTKQEFIVLSKLFEAGLPVPEPYYLEEESPSNSFMLTEFIEGPLLGQAMMGVENDKVPVLLKMYIDELARINKLDWRSLFNASSIEKYQDYPNGYAKEILERRKRDVENFKLVDE